MAGAERMTIEEVVRQGLRDEHADVIGEAGGAVGGGGGEGGGRRMTIEEVVREVLRDEHGDVIRESVRAVARELMEVEVSELIGAERGERSEDRATHRNGYRARRWETRAGEI